LDRTLSSYHERACYFRVVPRITEEERAKRRRYVLDGARICFARRGYERTTVHDLEAQIGLSSGAIFNYFPSKLDLFIGVAADDAARLAQAWSTGGIRATIEAANDGRLSASYLELGRQIWSDPDFRHRWADRGLPLVDAIRRSFEADIAAGRTRPDLRLQTLVDYATVTLDGLLLRIRTGNLPADIDTLFQAYATAIYRP
jgi:AcrR family transcriptional regulator